MTTKLKINLSQGVLEVEGSETFVKTIYNDFKAHFVESDGPVVAEEEALLAAKPKRIKTPRNAKIRHETTPLLVVSQLAQESDSSSLLVDEPTPPPLPEPEPVTQPPVQEPALEPKAASLPLPTYIYIEDLKLGHTSSHPSLVEFMDAKLPITNEERNLVFLYYLQHTLKIKPITLDHVYTCYREAKIRAPLNIENSLRMTAEQRGWIKANQNGSMTVTPDGKQYVEKFLPKKVKN